MTKEMSINLNEQNKIKNKGHYIALDISTSCIGMSIFNQDYELVDLKHILLKTDKDVLPENRYLAKANMFKTYLQVYKEYNILDVVIEDPLVASNNVKTVNTLLRFNGICSYLIWSELNTIPKYITVHGVRETFCPEMCEYDSKKNRNILKFKSRKIDPKEYIFMKVSKLEPQLNWLYDKNGKLKDENYDMTDSYAVGKAFFIKKNIL